MASRKEYDYLRQRQGDLLESVNSASVGARTSWMFFLALMAYFFTANAGITHHNLLLNTPVELPFLNIGISLTQFFVFAPIVFLLVQLGMLVQHISLHRKVGRFSQKLREMETTALPEGEEYLRDDADWLRHQVSSYFYTQLYAGPMKRTMFHLLIILMYNVSFLVLPVVLLLYFQAKFIPYHDETITIWNRFYVIFGVLMLVGMRLITLKYESQTRRQSARVRLLRGFSLTTGFVFSLVAIFASIFVFTIPDSALDCRIRLYGGQLYYEGQKEPVAVSLGRLLKSPFKTFAIAKKALPDCRAGKMKPLKFSVAALLTGARLDPAHAGGYGFFDRNLIVADQEVVKTGITIKQLGGDDIIGIDNDSISLRGRNLRYANLDRSILREADFTAADLIKANLRGADLRKAKLTCAKQEKIPGQGGGQYGDPGDADAYSFSRCARLKGANLEGANLSKADLRGADFRSAKLRRAIFSGAFAISTDFTQAELSFATFYGTNMPRAIFKYANLTEANMNGARLRFAKLNGAIMSRAKLQGANLILADLTGTLLRRADLEGAKLNHAQLPGANLTGANLGKADLSYAAMAGADLSLAKLHSAKLEGTELQGVRMIAAKFHCANLLNADLRGADLRGAIFYGTGFNGKTDIGMSDLRYARYWQASAPLEARMIDLESASAAAPDDKIRSELRHEICRLRDYKVKGAGRGAKAQARGQKIAKCLKIAKSKVKSSFSDFMSAVRALDSGELYQPASPYNCARLEQGLSENDPSIWQSSYAYHKWQMLAGELAGARNSELASENVQEDSASFDPKSLSMQLIKLVCTEKPYARYIAEGVTRRIIHRIPDTLGASDPANQKWLKFKGDSAAFLDEMKSAPACGKARKMSGNLLWQLELAVEIERREAAANTVSTEGTQGAVQ